MKCSRWTRSLSPGGGRNFLRPQECISRSPENIRDEMQRGRIFCSLRVFSHTVVHNVWKIFSDPQNEHPGEWRPPRPLHALLRANWALTRPISESCWWSGTRSALKAPVQRRAVPGEGRASVRIFSTSVALGRDSLSWVGVGKGARLGVPGPQKCCISSRMTHFVLPCILKTILENRSPSPSLLEWTKTFLPRSGRHDNMLSPAHCDALWCRDSFRSRCREEISGPIIWVPLPAVLRGFWAGHGSLPSDREESPNSEQFRQKSTKSVRPSALVWTNLSRSIMRRSRAYHRCAPKQGDNTQHRTDRAPLWGEAVLLVRPSPRTRSPLKRGSGGALRGVESPHSTPRCISSAQGTILGVSVPLHGDSNLGVEWRPERSYLSEIVLPAMGSGRARHLSSSSSSRLQRGILLICGCCCSVLVFPPP